MCKKVFHTILFLLSFLHFASSQNSVISGQVVDKEGKGIESVIVIANAMNESKTMLGFAIADDEGNFTLEIKTSSDTFVLHCTHLSYAPVLITISTNEDNVIVVMEGKSNTLQEVLVKAERFRRSGDTLFFDVAQTQKINDETIEDVIRRIPGVEISVSGQISYDGLPINKFYIEGMDMLEGRYNIASQNLKAQLIEEIQILERHQPIRALGGIVRPPNAAINLRLKSPVVYTYKAEMGGGVAHEPKYYGEVSSFRFTKESQSSLIGHVNNTGKATNYIFADHFNYKIRFDDLSLSRIPQPNLRQEFYRDNQEEALNLTWLKKLTEDKQMKIFAGGNHVTDRYAGENIRSWEVEDPVVFIDSLQNQSTVWQFNPRVVLENNAAVRYSKWQIGADGSLESRIGNQSINDIPIDETLENNIYEFSLANEAVFTRGKKALRVQSKLSYNDRQDEMEISPSTFIDDERMIFSLPATLQILDRSGLNASINTSVYIRSKDFLIHLPLGISGKFNRFDSELNALSGSAFQSLGSDFENEQSLLRVEPFVSPSTKYEKGIWEFSLGLPLRYTVSQLVFESETDSRNRVNGLNGELETSALARFRNGQTLNVNYTYANGFNTSETIYRGYVLSSYQYLQRADNNNIFRVRSNSLSAAYTFKSFRSGTSVSLNSSIGRFTRPFLDASQIDENGISTNLVQKENILDRASAGLKWTQELFSRVLLFRQDANLSVSIGNSIINGQEFKLPSRAVHSASSLEYANRHWGSSVGLNLNYTDNFFGEPMTITDLNYGLFIQTTKRSNLSMDVFLNRTTGQDGFVTFINLLYKQKFKGKFGEIKAGLTNITNSERYLTLTRTENFLSQSQISLRPRQFVVQYAFTW